MRNIGKKVLYIFVIYIFTLTIVVAKDDNTIIIASHIDPPSAYIKEGKFVGHNVEVATMLANGINKKVAFVSCPFARCLTMLKDGHADMMIAINKTSEREEYIDYLSKPFHSLITPVVFYVSKHKDINIERYDDLKGLNIGVLRGASYFRRFDEDKSLNKVYITTHRQLIDLMVKGRIDTFLGRRISIQHQVSEQIYQEELKEMPYIYAKQNDFYIGVSKKSILNEQVDELSRVLEELLKSGAIDALNNPYL